MKNKFLSILLILVMISGATALFANVTIKDVMAPAPLENRASSTELIGNEYIEFKIHNDGLYSIGTTGGNPDTSTDDNTNLLYQHIGGAKTSYTTIRLNGSSYKFVNVPIKEVDPAQLKSISEEIYEGSLKVQQVLTIVENPSTLRKDLVEIKYILTNVSSETIQAGTRIMLDTMLSDNDDAPFRIPGTGERIHEIEYIGSDIPQYWQAFDSFIDPTVISQGTFITDGINPDKVQFVSWRQVTSVLWDYSVTLDKLIGDSAVNVIWEEAPLAAGDSKEFKTYYGLSSLTGDMRPPIAVTVTAPQKLNVNAAKTDYVPNPFTVTAYLSNIGSDDADNVIAEITLPAGLTLVGGANPLLAGTMAPGDDTQHSWQVKADPSDVDVTYTYAIEVDYEGSDPAVYPKIIEKTLFVPGLEDNNGGFKYAVFAGNVIGKIAYSGRNHDVTGDVHTNNVFTAAGENININGTCEASTAIQVIPGVNIINEVVGAPYIETPDFATELQSQIANATVSLSGDQTLTFTSSTIADSYYVDGNVTLSIADCDGPKYVIATGSINIDSITATTQNALTKGELVYASLTGDININVDGAEMTGILFAKEGSVNISGQNLNVAGSVIAGHTVNISGDNIDINGTSNIQENRPPVITSSPVTPVTVSDEIQTLPLDLSSWSPIIFEPSNSGDAMPIWELSDGNRTAKQTVNARPSILMGDFYLSNTKVEGTFYTDDTDDDYMGFVFGYQDMKHFYLFDWRENNVGNELGGMNVKVVNSDTTVDMVDLTKTFGVPGKITSLYHNDVPYQRSVLYHYTLEFNDGEFTITVTDGNLVNETFTIIDDTYTDGFFGFYNCSQTASYTGFSLTSLPVANYIYDVEAYDPDGDLLDYSLTAGPFGMVINPVTGEISWKYTALNAGTHPVTIVVEDGRGGSDTQSYDLEVVVSQ